MWRLFCHRLLSVPGQKLETLLSVTLQGFDNTFNLDNVLGTTAGYIHDLSFETQQKISKY